MSEYNRPFTGCVHIVLRRGWCAFTSRNKYTVVLKVKYQLNLANQHIVSITAGCSVTTTVPLVMKVVVRDDHCGTICMSFFVEALAAYLCHFSTAVMLE